MNTFDLSPLWQSTVGFDRLTDLMEDSVRRMGGDNYPPYNIERAGEDHYQISLALAGFAPDEVTFIAEPNVLTIEGRRSRKVSTSMSIRVSLPDLSDGHSTWRIMCR